MKVPKQIIRFIEAVTGKVSYGQPLGGGKAELVFGFDSIFASGSDSARTTSDSIAVHLTGEVVEIKEVLAPIPKPP